VQVPWPKNLLTLDYAYGESGHLERVSNVDTGFPAMNTLGQMQAATLGGTLEVERLAEDFENRNPAGRGGSCSYNTGN
jgi:hypothetical protein